MSKHNAVLTPGLELSEAIGVLRDELLKARDAGAASAIQLPVESMTVQLQVAATRSRDGKAGFAVPIVNSVGWQQEVMQTVTVVFSEPIDHDGNPVKIARPSIERKG